MSEPTLEINGVEKSFGAKRVLQGVRLQLNAGRITALLAKNGAGKSTLVSLIAGRLLPDRGRNSFYGPGANDSRIQSTRSRVNWPYRRGAARYGRLSGFDGDG